MQHPALERQVTLLDLLDRVLTKGVIIQGDLTLSVANVDLVYVGLKILLTSIERAEHMQQLAQGATDDC
jgi:hypothetical protein